MVDKAPTIDLTKYVEAKLFGDRPHIRGRRVLVAALAHNSKTNGWDIATVAREFSLSEAEVLAALLYYEEHRESIDAQESAEEAAMDEAYRRSGKQ